MKTWEVIIPPAGGGTLQTLLIEAATSMMALSEGLRQLADPAHLSSLMCKIMPHGTLEVVDNKSGRTITIREIDPAQLQAPPAAVPPPDPSAARQQGADTSVGLPAMGGEQKLPPQQSAPGTPVRKRRPTQELISTATGIANGQATPPPAQMSPPEAAPKFAGPPVAAPPMAAPPVAAPPMAAPPVAAPPVAAPPPPTAQVPTVDPLRSSGEVMGVSVAPSKPITEPAIIIDDHLQAEIEQLEHLRKAREAAMTPPTMRPIPHKVFKVLAEAAEAPRFETVRRRYVSVWPNPPRDALVEVLQIQIAQVRGELESVTGAKRVLVAAFDHAFEKIPLRPPLGLCTWNTVGAEESEAGFVYGDQAAQLWGPTQPVVGGGESPMTAPADDPNATALGRHSDGAAEAVKTAIVTTVDAEGRPIISSEEVPPTAQGAAVQLPVATAPVGAPADAAIDYASAPPPVQYPAELQGQVYDAGQTASAPEPPTGTLDPFYAPAHGATPAAPVAPEPTDLLSVAFERFQPLFYITDRQQALAFALDTAMGLVPSGAGVILLYDYGVRDLYSAVVRVIGNAQIPGYRTAVTEGLAGFCATQGLPLSLSQGDQDERFSSVLGAQCGIAVYTLAGVPIQYQGRLFGVMELANRQAGESYTTEELNALAYIGRQLAERLSTTLSTQMPAIQDPNVEPPTS